MTAVSSTSAPTAAPPGPLRLFWLEFSSNKGALAGLILILTMVFLAIFAPWVAPHSPIEQFRDALLKPPVWYADGSWRHILGTDDIGRDILSRILHGARVSLVIAVAVVAASIVVGIAIGLIAGFFRGLVETALLRFMDILQSMPTLLLALTIVAILGPGLNNAMVAVCIVLLPSFVRLTHAAVISEMSKDYVLAARMIGSSKTRLMIRTVLPNCLAPLIVQASLSLSTAILDTAALGFLGQGAQPPTPEWGTMLSDATQYLQSAWWVTLPGVAILLAVLAFNLIGDGLRDALDPKLKRS
ncbi:ABC transporter permease subunit [Elstera cyanobacteriorum]|uniref:Dipeptide ABC transporter permease DppC n=1 Tax=Elstera cyanobacteriorum TaxID=2022747 RepID=A0A255XMB4_9PROT|nr:ABC transporter permease subunit [Elstera cyanobacteriorum]MCK6441304.1 ABC transporter permease subunit [Elstera cyanobacteriorum]OYQ18021.1 dipeptide ABC transporter permease DppC [Elstera cyanobacteriorum]GFZ84418.1 dipeptide ABC transporter permease DppC [Elstera cyanobacteriorum]